MLRKKIHVSTPPSEPDRPNPPPVVIASAALVSKAELRAVTKAEPWHEDAWTLWDKVPSLRYGTEWRANANSRARIYAGKVPTGTEDPEPVDDERLLQPLNELFDGASGQPPMLYRMTLQLGVVGETYLVGFDQPNGQPGGSKRRWLVCSRDEFSLSGDTLKIRLPETDQQFEVNRGQAVVIRVWRPHPRRAFWSDSPARGVLDAAKELVGLSSRVSAEIDSRLAGAGILKWPSEITMPNPAQSEGVNPINDDPIIAGLITAMVTPLKDRDSAGAVVPIVVKGPAEALKAMEHMTFAQPLDAQIIPLRESALRDIAIGLDVEPETILGMGGTNHWTGWLLSESDVKVHARPILELLCAAITEQYYRPALAAMKVEHPDQYMLWPDTANLALRPNRAPESLELYKLGLIKGDTVVREHGFGGTDLPDKDEARRHLVLRLLEAIPALAPYLLPLVGLDVPQTVQGQVVDERRGARRDQAPASDSDDGRQLPETQPGEDEQEAPSANQPVAASTTAVVAAVPDADPALAPVGHVTSAPNGPAPTTSLSHEGWRLACLEIAALRALERSGKWLLGRSRSNRQHSNIPAHEMHTVITVEPDQIDKMLDGAYTELHAALPDEPCLHQAVDNYVRAMLVTGHRHERRWLEVALQQSGCLSDAA